MTRRKMPENPLFILLLSECELIIGASRSTHWPVGMEAWQCSSHRYLDMLHACIDRWKGQRGRAGDTID